MIQKKFILIIALFTLHIGINATETLKKIDRWQHKGILIHRLFDGKIDKDGDMILCYSGTGSNNLAVVSKKKFVPFGIEGEAPSDLRFCMSYYFIGDDLAVVEFPQRTKIFQKKDGTYIWKANKWFKRSAGSHNPFDSFFFDNKYFMAGYNTEDSNQKETVHAFLLRIYDSNGIQLKNLIPREYGKDSRMYQMIHHIVHYKSDLVYFLSACDPKLIVISTKSLEITSEIPLELPSFYRKMPEYFYRRESYADRKHSLKRDLEDWDMGYSRITRLRIDGNRIVVQMQTCDPKLKKFAILLYNADTFKLENTLNTDDYLLDVKNGKYYFFTNGQPGRDDDEKIGENCIIDTFILK